MTYVARDEYCRTCGGFHPRYLNGCPKDPIKDEYVEDPVPDFVIPFPGVPVDPTSNKRGVYHTLWFKCPKCGYDSVMVKSNYCSNCGVKLSWE